MDNTVRSQPVRDFFFHVHVAEAGRVYKMLVLNKFDPVRSPIT